jgi:hypothetical protein
MAATMARGKRNRIDVGQYPCDLIVHDAAGANRLSREGAMAAAGVAQIYLCPMHADVRQAGPGQCPKCGMALLPEGTRFGLLRHMFSSPLHIAGMVVAMVAIMAAVMALVHLG